MKIVYTNKIVVDFIPKTRDRWSGVWVSACIWRQPEKPCALFLGPAIAPSALQSSRRISRPLCRCWFRRSRWLHRSARWLLPLLSPAKDGRVMSVCISVITHKIEEMYYAKWLDSLSDWLILSQSRSNSTLKENGLDAYLPVKLSYPEQVAICRGSCSSHCWRT